MEMPLLIELLTRFGLPTALLIFLMSYHIRAIRTKDREIQRINESRLKEQKASADRMMEIAQEFTQLSGEQEKTLAILSSRLDMSLNFKRNN